MLRFFLADCAFSHISRWKTAYDATYGRTVMVPCMLEAFGQDKKTQNSFFECQGNIVTMYKKEKEYQAAKKATLGGMNRTSAPSVSNLSRIV